MRSPVDSSTGGQVMVTGATGFVGRHVVSELINKGYPVIALVRNIDKAKEIASIKNATFHKGDITNAPQVFDGVQCDALIHCAWGDVRDTLSPKHLEEHAETNYLFIKGAVEHGIKKVIVTGTCYEYGLQYGPMAASASTKPNTPYAQAKDGLHNALRKLQSHSDFELIWARLFYMYGEGQNPKTIMALFDVALEKGDKVFNMSYGEQLLDYLPIGEVAGQLAGLLKSGSAVVNICSGKPVSLRRLLEQRMKEKNKHIELNLGFYDYRKQDSLALWGDPDEMKAAL